MEELKRVTWMCVLVQMKNAAWDILQLWTRNPCPLKLIDRHSVGNASKRYLMEVGMAAWRKKWLCQPWTDTRTVAVSGSALPWYRASCQESFLWAPPYFYHLQAFSLPQLISSLMQTWMKVNHFGSEFFVQIRFLRAILSTEAFGCSQRRHLSQSLALRWKNSSMVHLRLWVPDPDSSFHSGKLRGVLHHLSECWFLH